MAVLVKTLNGLAYASVKTRNSLAVASIKNINGLDATAGGGSLALIANTAQQGAVNGVTTGSIDTTGANFLAIATSQYKGGGAADVTVSDSKSNTWTPLTAYGDGTNQVRIFYCFGGTVGSGHTFAVAGSNSYSSLAVMAWSNIASSPFDVENGASAFQGNLPTGSITPSQNNELILSAGAYLTNTGGAFSDPTISGAFSISDQAIAVFNTSIGLVFAYKVITDGSAQNPTLFFEVGPLQNLGVTIAGFKY